MSIYIPKEYRERAIEYISDQKKESGEIIGFWEARADDIQSTNPEITRRDAIAQAQMGL